MKERCKPNDYYSDAGLKELHAFISKEHARDIEKAKANNYCRVPLGAFSSTKEDYQMFWKSHKPLQAAESFKCSAEDTVTDLKVSKDSGGLAYYLELNKEVQEKWKTDLKNAMMEGMG